MDRIKPEYVDQVPKDKSGGMLWTMIIGLVLLATMIGAWQIYAGTVAGWEKRFGKQPTPAAIPAGVAESRAQATVAAANAEANLRALNAAHLEQEKPFDKCINGVAFRKLNDGGWENIPGIRCE